MVLAACGAGKAKATRAVGAVGALKSPYWTALLATAVRPSLSRPFRPSQSKVSAVSTKDESGPSAPPGEPSHHGYDVRPIPDRVLAMLLAALAVALVLGYLFVNKMVDISRQEDCALARHSNCAPVELPNR